MQSMETRTVNFEHMSFYEEKHGEESVQGVALKFSFDASNALLDSFAPGLRASLYRAAEPGDPQELFEDKDNLTLLRYPKMPAFRYGEEMVGRDVTIGYGIADDGAIHFEDCTADKFAFELKQGGSITVTFRVKVKPSAEQVAKLFDLKGGEVDLTISAGVTRQTDIEDGDGDGDADPENERAFPDAIDGTGEEFPAEEEA